MRRRHDSLNKFYFRFISGLNSFPPADFISSIFNQLKFSRVDDELVDSLLRACLSFMQDARGCHASF